jgi:Ca2+-binding RTX toxin-like protein
MLITEEVTGLSPLFTLERAGAQLTGTLSYGLSGYYDEDLGYYLWDGELSAYIGEIGGDYLYQTSDRPMDISFTTSAMALGEVYLGNVYLTDNHDGTYISVDFNAVIFGAAAVYTGAEIADYAFGSAFADQFSGLGGDDGFEGAGGNDRLSGGAGFDLLDGGDGADQLSGGADADRLIGGLGADVLMGGLGADRLHGGGGLDTASYIEAASGLVAALSNSAVNTGEAAGDVYVSIENLTGSKFGDNLIGSAEANVIRAGAGDDKIRGGLGSDTLFGNGGKDAFIFNTKASATNIDRVEDFAAGVDRIWLDDSVYKALAPGVLVGSQFVSNASGLAQDADDRIIYQTGTGKLFYDLDGTGAGASVHFATLTGNPPIGAGDFLVM